MIWIPSALVDDAVPQLLLLLVAFGVLAIATRKLRRAEALLDSAEATMQQQDPS